jgi:hypothetical protein
MKTSSEDPKPDREVSDKEIPEIARDAYIYAYPLVLMQVSRQVSTNVMQPTGLLSPINQFAHGREWRSSRLLDCQTS